jgi:hypothetical protein
MQLSNKESPKVWNMFPLNMPKQIKERENKNGRGLALLKHSLSFIDICTHCPKLKIPLIIELTKIQLKHFWNGGQHQWTCKWTCQLRIIVISWILGGCKKISNAFWSGGGNMKLCFQLLAFWLNIPKGL